MTPDERQAIREKHFFWKDKECNWDGEPYPCDVIKVLDAWDEATPTEATSSECDHRTAGLLPEPDGTLEIIEFNFCPKCGEKL